MKCFLLPEKGKKELEDNEGVLNVQKVLKEKHTLQNPLLSPMSLACARSGTLFTREHYSLFKCFKCRPPWLVGFYTGFSPVQFLF